MEEGVGGEVDETTESEGDERREVGIVRILRGRWMDGAKPLAPKNSKVKRSDFIDA